MGKCIGQITLADGFIPNKNSVENDEITVEEYGSYRFVMEFSGDTHVIACASSCNNLSAFGYKASKSGSEQANWMVAYDIDSKMPLANQMFNGADPDKTAVQSLFERMENQKQH